MQQENKLCSSEAWLESLTAMVKVAPGTSIAGSGLGFRCILSQFPAFLDYCCFLIHDVFPVQSRDAITQSHLNQHKASSVQPNTA